MTCIQIKRKKLSAARVRAGGAESEQLVNILFHLYLSGDDPEIMAGNFMGDFVKGVIGDRYAPRIGHGLKLHRSIDSFAQSNDHFQASRLRMAPRYGLYRGVCVDLFFDHFLACDWNRWADVPLPEYIASTRSVIDRYVPIMPERLQRLIPVIFDELLLSYRTVAGIESALLRMSRRVRRPDLLAEGAGELTIHYDDLKLDFERFIRDVQEHAAGVIATFPG